MITLERLQLKVTNKDTVVVKHPIMGAIYGVIKQLSPNNFMVKSPGGNQVAVFTSEDVKNIKLGVITL